MRALAWGRAEPIRLYPLVAPYLPVPPDRVAEDVSLLVASLFGEFGRAGVGGMTVARAIRVAGAEGSASRTNDLATAILTARRDELAPHLRRGLFLAQAKVKAPLDWHRLFADLLAWQRTDQAVQRAWARDFWASAAPATSEVASGEGEGEGEDDGEDDGEGASRASEPGEAARQNQTGEPGTSHDTKKGFIE